MNEKFALRAWMVKLGMNGAEFGAARKWFCKNLAGDAAFATPESKAKWQVRHTKKADVTSDEVSE